MIGIYGIRNIVNNKVYVGQSIHIKERWKQHQTELIRGIHNNYYLQAAWNKYGKDNFVFEIIEECLQSELNIKETYWKLYFDPNTYNLGNTGCIATTSKETRQKISEGVRRRNACLSDEERKQKFGHAGNRVPRTERTKEKISQSLKGRASYIRSAQCKEKSRLSNHNKQPVIQSSKDGLFIREWPSIQEAARTLQIDQGNISATCRGRYKTYKGFQWHYKN